MDYTGKRVFHKAKYGEGMIVSSDSKGYIYVKYQSEEKLKKYAAPDCFKVYLQLLDQEANQQLQKEITLHDEKKSDDKAKAHIKTQTHLIESISKDDQTYSSSMKAGLVHVPVYNSVESFCIEQASLLSSEIYYLKKNGGKKVKLFKGSVVEKKNGLYYYAFEADSELNYPDHTQITIWLLHHAEGIAGVLVSCEDFTVIIASLVHLGDEPSLIEFSSETWRLLQFLKDRLDKIRLAPSPIVKSLICDGKKNIKYGKPITKGQDNACKMSISQPICFIWGPPGTGKTETLANIARLHIQKGLRVLMLSYSNVSVDGAVWRVIKKMPDAPEGTIVRYGYPKDKELINHPFLTAYNFSLSKHKDLLDERNALIKERRKLSKTSKEYIEISERLTQIRDLLDGEEKAAVKRASFVATTVSKAIADRTLYNSHFDTVIFDEASMAYVPQIVFSASLATKHFICMGDFAQLPPIVQSDKASALNIDIFRHCGIVDAVESGQGHSWLCMLDTQYRMHPTIAAFAGATMYHGLLKSGPDMGSLRKPISQSAPFPGNTLHLLDLSGMMSVCTKTADQSRINILSAMISMGLAIKAAKHHEVGIISPYNAQSRLLHAMARDLTEQYPDMKAISCATVHQFQGSEKDVIIYDAVDCYRMPFPGTLLTSTSNDYANRLYNVAVTRAKGKMISVVNVNYMEAKNLSKKLIFRRMINSMTSLKMRAGGSQALKAIDSTIMPSYSYEKAWDAYLHDISMAKKEIYIDIPGGTSGDQERFSNLVELITNAKHIGAKVIVRTDNKYKLPHMLINYAITNPFISNPITLIDKRIVWYGMPPSDADFIAEDKIIPTKYRPIFRFVGRHFAQALYGFQEMNDTLDKGTYKVSGKDSETYPTFASYVSGELKCPSCKGKMRLRKSKKGKFFLACSNYPKCNHTQFVEENMIEDYFYFQNDEGKHCPRDNTSLVAKLGKYGVYVCCCNSLERHTYKLDEI